MANQSKSLWEDLVDKFNQLQKLDAVPFDVVRQGQHGIEILLDFPENKPHWHDIAWNSLSERVEWYQQDESGQMRLVSHDESQLEQLLALAGIQLTMIGLRPPPRPKSVKIDASSANPISLNRRVTLVSPTKFQKCCCSSLWIRGVHTVFAHMTPEAGTREKMKPIC